MGERGPVLKAYHAPLGEFISMFARTKAMVQETLAHYAKLDKDTAMALLSGVKIDQAKNYLNRIFEAKPYDESAKVELGAFMQIGIINDVRNDLIHYGADVRHQ
jgi:hypothetical protein